MKNNSKSNLKALGKLAVFCRKYIFAVIVAIAFAVIATVCTIIGPKQLETIVNELHAGVMGNLNLNAILTTGWILLAIYGVGAILGYIQQTIMSVVTQKSARNMRSALSKKINRLPLNYFDTTSHGDILSRMTNDVDTVAQMLSQNLSNLINGIVMFVGTLVMMFITNWVLALVTIGCSLLGFVIMTLLAGKSQKYFASNQEGIGNLNGHIEEIYSNHQVVIGYNGEQAAIDKFDGLNGKLYKSNFKSQFLSGCMSPVMTLTGNLAYVMIFIVGVAMILGGSSVVTLGTITAFVMYAKLFSQPLTNIAQAMNGMQQAAAASSRVFSMLDEEEMTPEKQGNENDAYDNGNVEFSHIKFGYVPEREIIHNFSLKVKSGQKVAIVGPTGSGKSTLINLLMRFYELNDGSILIDSKDIQDRTRSCVRRKFDMILQDTWLFEGTVRENLIFNQKDISEARLDEVCEAVGLTHFIKGLPQGYDTVLSESNTLSEGQKQQLTIARAMLKNSPMLILDEATSSVDTRTEQIIQNAMDRMMHGRTCFVIAHRLSTIKDADVILVLKDGDICEMGTHNELLENKGFYADLYNSQFAA